MKTLQKHEKSGKEKDETESDSTQGGSAWKDASSSALIGAYQAQASQTGKNPNRATARRKAQLRITVYLIMAANSIIESLSDAGD